ncbi:ADP-ribosylation factor family-domain-containing protein [Cladochytrium replicatum]|nr:ADP-ribosylation factor family-domain-containing protein [Cladochytrium replicatum]
MHLSLIPMPKVKAREKEIRILMLGLDNAGKTTILKRINGEDISTISPTLGFNIKTFEHNNYKLNVWDVGGQKSNRSYWRNYFEQTDGLVWVVDSADWPDGLDDCRKELYALLGRASLLIFANKQATHLRNVTLDSIQTHHWHIESRSAVSGTNLLEGMDWIVGDIAFRIYMLE